MSNYEMYHLPLCASTIQGLHLHTSGIKMDLSDHELQDRSLDQIGHSMPEAFRSLGRPTMHGGRFAWTLVAGMQSVLFTALVAHGQSANVRLVGSIGAERTRETLSPWTTPRLFGKNRVAAVLKDDATIGLFDLAGKTVATIETTRLCKAAKSIRITKLFIISGDTILAYEANTSTLFRVSTSTKDCHPSIVFPTEPSSLIPLSNNGYLFEAAVGTAESAGFPLHATLALGALRSFGIQNSDLVPGKEISNRRIMAQSRHSGAAWTTRVDSVQLEEWSSDGKLLASLKRWGFADNLTPFSGKRNLRAERPAWRVSGLRQFDDTILMLIVTGPDKSWRPEKAGAASRSASDFESNVRELDSRIELVDSRSGRILYTKTMDRPIAGAADDSTVISKRNNADGSVAVDLWRVSLPNVSKGVKYEKVNPC